VRLRLHPANISVKTHVSFFLDMEIEIREMAVEDWEQVRAIYVAGITIGQSTFETEAPNFSKWNTAHLQQPRLVAVFQERVCGWAALSPVSTRAVYAGVAEVSVYVDLDLRGKRIGSLLLEALVRESERNGIWTLQASIFPENVASASLHKLSGFREVGRRERIGRKDGVWRDTVLFERRSKLVGI
jgi:L-amino acid N-acyltransferase YncA